MRDTRKRRTQRRPRCAAQEPKVVRIHFHPGHDAQDRLRRVYTILVNHALTRRQKRSDEEP